MEWSLKGQQDMSVMTRTVLRLRERIIVGEACRKLPLLVDPGNRIMKELKNEQYVEMGGARTSLCWL